MGKVAVQISEPLLRDFITEGNEFRLRVIEGLPEGAEFERSFFEEWTGIAVLIYQHESLPSHQPGEQILRISPTVQNLSSAYTWTILPPIEAGAYWVYAKNVRDKSPDVHCVEVDSDGAIDYNMDGYECEPLIERKDITHWMGPIATPEPPEVTP